MVRPSTPLRMTRTTTAVLLFASGGYLYLDIAIVGGGGIICFHCLYFFPGEVALLCFVLVALLAVDGGGARTGPAFLAGGLGE